VKDSLRKARSIARLGVEDITTELHHQYSFIHKGAIILSKLTGFVSLSFECRDQR
jgi:hypothetical protein